MDGNRFDSMAKGFAERRSRRGALRTLLGGALGGAATIAGVNEADATSRRVKTDCCPASNPTLCGLTCTSTSTDPLHCGSCEHACPGGQACTNGACATKSNGQTCTVNTECGSGFCADGVCCNGACSSQCEACNKTGSVGTCAAISGSPIGSRSACATDGALCGGTCNGVNRTACAYPGASSACRAASCSGGTETLAAMCDGAGHCPAPTTHACAPFTCGGSACLTTCTNDAGCTSGGYCDLSNGSPGVCRQDLGNGAACARDAQCLSGHCAGGVCCTTACSGATSGCMSCATGSCVNVATNTPCQGGFCNGSGTCVGCITASECPGTDTDCRQRSCNAGVCGFNFAAAGTVVASQIAGDCHSNRCDGNGGVVSVIDDNDVPFDSNQCTSGVCINGAPSYTPSLVGTACNQNSGQVCDGSGHCVQCNAGGDCQSGVCSHSICQAPTCQDGVKNGTETDVDCGGDVCLPCGNGKTCLVSNDCARQQNANGVCSGGICGYTCITPYSDCDNNPTNGCEVNTASDPGNCGGCSHICSVANGTAGCSNGHCTVATCYQGWGDCNANAVDGCEINLNTDPSNCGRCGNRCGTFTPNCIRGVCKA